MGDRLVDNCGDCAYVQKENGKLWCPFHDLPVRSDLVCDEFLDEYDSPQWQSLINGMEENSNPRPKVPQYTASDIVAYVCTFVIIICSVLNCLFD